LQGVSTGFDLCDRKMNSSIQTCPNDEMAAYLDGELEGAEGELFELHIGMCAKCAARLQEQKRFLCELNLALNLEPTPSLPENFVEVIAANAQSDMSGMRTVAERNRAFRIIGLLVIACLVIFGAAARDYLTSILRPVVSLGEFAGQTLYSVGAGAAIVSRSVGGHLILESNFVGTFLLILFAAAAVLLPALISRYHRAQS
jgi:anti-sigma factor RsiW